MVILEIIRPEVSWKFSWEESTSQSVEKLTQWTLLSGDNPVGQLRSEEELGLVYIFTVGWFQTLFLQILKSLNPKISTKPSDSSSKISQTELYTMPCLVFNFK